MLAVPPCRARLGEFERRWLAMHAAVAEGKGPEIARTAKEILDNDPRLRGELLAQALAAYMVGSIMTGERGAASQAYAKYRRNLGQVQQPLWKTTFQLLLGHTDFVRQP